MNRFHSAWLPRAVSFAVAVSVLGVTASASATEQNALPAELFGLRVAQFVFPERCAKPVWPRGSLRRLEQGTVRLAFRVGEDGTVGETKVVKSSGYTSLDEAATAGVVKCKFLPKDTEGFPRQAWLPVQYVWTIDGVRQQVVEIERGAELYRIWADAKSAEDQFGIARAYRTGRGVPRDDAEAAEWYHRAAQKGHASAQYNLGSMYLVGEGVAKSEAEAVKWMRRAAEQGHATAQFNLGAFYIRGQGVDKSVSDAERWMRKAAEQGLAAAQVQLGDMYDEGRGVPPDAVQSAAWYRKAADQGNVTGQYYLAQCFEFGVGVKQDLEAARAWYAKAAGKGHREAAEALSRITSS